MITQVGLAYLDTRDLRSDASDVIQVRYFCVSGLKRLVSEKSQRK